MRWTIIRVICISVLLITLSAAAVGFGRLHPASDPLQRLYDVRSCNGQPCYKGIIPGVTALSEVFAMFNRTFDASLAENTFQRTINILNAPTYEVFLDTHSGQVDNVTIQFNKAAPPLVYFVMRYGIPCQVETSRQLKLAFAILHYPSADVALTVPYGAVRLMPDTPIYVLQMSTFIPKFSDNCTSLSDSSMSRQPWKGFALFRRYQP